MTRPYESRTLGLVDLDSLEGLDARQLTALYGEIAVPVRDFATVEDGRRAFEKLLEPTPKLLRPQQKRLCLPCRGLPKDPNPGSQEATLVVMIENGTTFDEVAHRFGWNVYRTQRALKLLHLRFGFGIEEGADGSLRFLDAPVKLRIYKETPDVHP